MNDIMTCCGVLFGVFLPCFGFFLLSLSLYKISLYCVDLAFSDRHWRGNLRSEHEVIANSVEALLNPKPNP